MLTKKKVRIRSFIIFILIMISIAIPADASDNKKDFIQDFSSYYYNQLDKTEKAIYDNLVNSQEKFFNEEEVIFKITNYDSSKKVNFKQYVPKVQKVRKAYVYDNPEVDIWFENYKFSLRASKDAIYLVSKPKRDFFEKQGITAKELENFQKKCKDFVETLSGTETEKLEKIHNWLTQIAVYDYTISKPNTRSAYGTIMKGSSVCSGFAYAYKYLADLAGLRVLYVVGNTYNKKNDTYSLHAWNVAYVKGKYYLVDVTFDLSKDKKPKKNYCLSKVNDEIHYADTDEFNYDF